MRKTSRQAPSGGRNAERSPRTATATSTSPPRRNAHDVRARLDRLVAAGERLRPPRAQRERAPDQVELRRRRRRDATQPPAQLPVDRAAVVGVDEREQRQLVALVDVGHARATVSLSSVCPSDDALARSRQRARRSGTKLRHGASSRPARTRFAPRLPGSWSGSIQFVLHLRLAQRLLEVGLEPLGVDRPGADEVWRIRYASFGVAPAARSARRDARAAHSAGIPASAPSRARTSPLRLVSCVVRREQAAREARARSRFAAWKPVDAQREAAGVAADLVQRDEAGS